MTSPNIGDHAAAYYMDNALGPKTYDPIYGPHNSPANAFYLDCANKFGGPLLEVGCGTGLVTWTLADGGHQVVGIDISEPMLAVARSKGTGKSAEVQGQVDFRIAAMETFELSQTFRTAIIPGRSFQHLLTPEKQRAALTCIHRHLTEDGTLVMNLFDPKLDYCMPQSESPAKLEEAVDPVSGMKVRRHFLARTTDPLTQTFTEHMRLEVFDAQGSLVSQGETQWSLRWTYAQEMRHLFELTGFRVEALYGDYEFGPPCYAQEQIWICRKGPPGRT
ncbi:MAG: class I SAM-dependent methyltransferase [Pseudomonadota bacterium]